MMRIFGVVLAGGQGRRFGGVDKAALRLGGDRLIDLAIGRLHPQVEALAISANGAGDRFGRDFPVLRDDAALGPPFGPTLGPLAGLLAAMHWAALGGADHLVTVAVDTPHFPCDLVARLHLALDAGGAAAALARGLGGRVHGTFGLWPVAIGDDLAAFLQSGANPKVTDFAARHHLAYADFEDDLAFDNINTAADLARLELALGGKG
jgi:molybdopterin-guanine dinucleotide biosynthesis protein A